MCMNLKLCNCKPWEINVCENCKLNKWKIKAKKFMYRFK